jgi:hypothetical protein
MNVSPYTGTKQGNYTTKKFNILQNCTKSNLILLIVVILELNSLVSFLPMSQIGRVIRCKSVVINLPQSWFQFERNVYAE